jgi:hypothetical protein
LYFYYGNITNNILSTRLLIKEIIMPMVKDKKFPYTAKGKKEAKEYAKKANTPMKAAPAKKMGAKRGY